MEKPHLSVNQLADYLVSSETSRMSILRHSKEDSSGQAGAIYYSKVRRDIQTFLCDPMRSVSILNESETLFSQRTSDSTLSVFWQTEAKHSIAILHNMHSLHNKISRFTFLKAPYRQPKLEIEGVDISVKADVLVRGKDNRIGAAVLRMTKNDASSPSKISRREKMGKYAATIVRRHVEQNLVKQGQKIDPKLCMSIDVQYGEVFFCPPATTQRIKNVENACQMIAAVWPML